MPSELRIPLTGWADRQLQAFARLAPGLPIAEWSGATLLGERAALRGSTVSGPVSAGGGCRLYPAADGWVALNLARPADRDLLQALFTDATLDPRDDEQVGARLSRCPARTIVARGRELGLALASLAETPVSPACLATSRGPPAPASDQSPLVIDLAALWAGPLASQLLRHSGARAVKVESLHRPDALRDGDPALFARLNGGKDSVVVDLSDPPDRQRLVALLRRADIVIEAARPRALQQLGVDADAIVRESPGVVWVSITGHGINGEAADWVGFGDDCGVAGGLSAALLDATGAVGFVGDAIADPLTGIAAARAALAQRRSGRGSRLVLAMSAVAAAALAWEKRNDPAGLEHSLGSWAAARGARFPAVPPRPMEPVRPLGADTAIWLGGLAC